MHALKPRWSLFLKHGCWLCALLTVLLAVLLLMPGVQAAEVILANLQQQGTQVHVDLLLDQPVKYKVFTLDHPYRVVIDLEGVAISPTLKALPPQLDAQHPYLSGIRIAPFNAQITRLVFDIRSDNKPQVTDLRAGGAQQKLAIGIQPLNALAEPSAIPAPGLTAAKTLNEAALPSGSAANVASPTSDTGQVNSAVNQSPDKSLATGNDQPVTAAAANNENTSNNTTAQASSSPMAEAPKPPKVVKPGQRLITIAVDAGHGGEDPGARGANGSHEKHITLAIARKLKQQFDNEENLQAILIRDGDYFVPLGDRVKKARAAKADLFISIHADSFVNSTAKGSSVFALSERGATSAGARYLAKKENAVDLIGGVSIDTRDMDLARTLLDLSQTATIHDSIRMGKAVLSRIAKINTLHSKGVEQAAFAVLKSPDIPSILVETAFISNPDEEAKLNDEAYQDSLVNAILTGVKSYIATNPSFAKK